MVRAGVRGRTGDWSAGSPLWTPNARKEAGFEEEESVFWMSFADFLSHFQAVNICCVKNWQELRIKGKFIRVQDNDDPNIEIVLSKWYYSIEIEERTQVIIGLHQEDERIEGTILRRPYLDIGLAVLKKTKDSLELVELRDLVNERETEIDVVLDPGSYIVIPRTTGCLLKRMTDEKTEDVKLVKEGVDKRVESTLRDIFRKYDMLLNNELTYVEFKAICECVGESLTEEQFTTEILSKYCSTSKGLSYRGFKDFFLDSIKDLGEEETWKWLLRLGYDRDLHPVRSKTFVLSFHSDVELAVGVKDAVPSDLDNRTNALIIEKFGQEAENKKGVKVLYSFSQ